MKQPISFQHLAPDYIQRFEAYIPSKPDDELKKLFGCSHLFRLNNNENPLGPCLSAARVISSFVPSPQASIYPSGDCWLLRQKLAEKHGMDPNQFLFGNGANEVIAFVIKAFCQKGDNIITADKTFAVYEWVAEFSGIEARLVPLKDYGFDDDEMIRRIDEHTKILFVCNPNNPTGTYWNSEKLRGFLNRINGRRIVVVDEAYCEFVEKPDFPDSMSMIAEYPNLVVFRTFSKMHALAGLRIGYLAGSSEAVDIIRRTCVVYSVNTLAQAAALAVLEDNGEHVQQTRDLVRRQKQVLTEYLANWGLQFLSGEGNFIMIRLPMSDSLAYRRLMMQGVMVRTMTGFRFPNWIRVTIALPDAMDSFMTGMENILKT
jgi:histidinol-phosphate aminotransferase